MLYSKQEGLNDRIVRTLLDRPKDAKTLHAELASGARHLSLRGVYKAVDQLIEAGVLIKVRKQVRVDGEWLGKVRSKLISPLPVLAVGERVSYSFTSIGHLDAFWKTLVLGLESLEQDGKVFFYNPHNFWALLPERRESEEAYYGHFAENRIHAYFTVGGLTQADLEFKRRYQNEYLQIDMRDMPGFPRRTHITLLGDYVISVRIPKALALKIDNLYASGRASDDMAAEIAALCGKPGTIRLLLEHNPLKARKMRRSLSLNFYFKF